MERVKEMKIRKNWTLLITVIIVCLVMVWIQMPQALAAEKDANQDADYLDPFSLTILSMTSIDPTDITATTVPVKIWIPYRPTFRSPCVPSY